MQTLQNSPEHTQTGHIAGKKQVLPLYKIILPFEILILRLPEITTYNSFLRIEFPRANGSSLSL